MISAKKIRNHLESYLVEHKLKSIVIGVSGGIDSALVCALAKPVCARLNIPIIGRSISIVTNTKEEQRRANHVGVAFCNDFENIDMSEEFNVLVNSTEQRLKNETEIHFKIRMGNLKARLRMIKLYDIASATGGLVMSTDNLTEYLLGFSTLHGDVGDLGIIQNMWKTEVYEMAEMLCAYELYGDEAIALMQCILCNATDGLGITSTDLDQIMPDWRKRHSDTRGGYEEVDDTLLTYFQTIEKLKSSTLTNAEALEYGKLVLEMKKLPVIQRHCASEFKRTNPYNIPRKDII